MDDEKDYFFDSDNEQNKDIIDGLRNLMISGCTLTELLNYVEAQLGDDIRYHTWRKIQAEFPTLRFCCLCVSCVYLA